MNPQQYLKPQEEVNITGCVRCGHYRGSDIFQLCGHPNSAYLIGDKKDFHTCAHMRHSAGSCGPDRRLAKNV